MSGQRLLMNPAYKKAYELGCVRAGIMGVGLSVEVRRTSEYQRRDKRGGHAWTNNDGDMVFLAAMLSKARHVFEVVSSGIVLATFDRRYEAQAFKEGFCLKKVRAIRHTVARLQAVRYVKVLGVRADAA
ncbi:MAG: hypothetical protein P1V97_06715 [Planctomycetota bacterium]|nr:hypothetical protein [Planctomycetota bacterium]